MATWLKTLLQWCEEYTDGYAVAVVRVVGQHNCGYVRLPANHPWYGKRVTEELCGHEGCSAHTLIFAVDVNGGINFASNQHPSLPKGWWVGFSCDHSGDLSETDDSTKCPDWYTYKDTTYVVSECLRLLAQARRAAMEYADGA